MTCKMNYYKKREVKELFDANDDNFFLLDEVIAYLDNKE